MGARYRNSSAHHSPNKQNLSLQISHPSLKQTILFDIEYSIMKCYRMGDFALRWREQESQVLLLAIGNEIYKTILELNFLRLSVSKTIKLYNSYFEWISHIANIEQKEIPQIHQFFKALQKVLFIENDLDVCFAISHHFHHSPYGERERTPIGQFLYKAKPYNHSVTLKNYWYAHRLAQQMHGFLKHYPAFMQADWIIPSPYHKSKNGFDLPETLCNHLSKWCNINNGSHLIIKNRVTTPMKECFGISQKLINIKDAFDVTDPSCIKGRKILIIDDLYQSGATLAEISRTLKKSGALCVYGLCATKTIGDG